MFSQFDGLRCAFICGKTCPFGAASPEAGPLVDPTLQGRFTGGPLRFCGVHWWTLRRHSQSGRSWTLHPKGSTNGPAATGEVHWWIRHYEGEIRWRASPSSRMSNGGLLHSRGGLLVDEPLQGGPLVDTPLQRWCTGGPSTLRDDIWVWQPSLWFYVCAHAYDIYIYIYI